VFNVTTDHTNKYLKAGLTIERCLELADGWEDPYAPIIVRSQDDPNVYIWDDSYMKIGMLTCGTKGRWGDLLMSRIETKEIVYVQPRTGWAGIALAALAQRHGKKLTLFMPASKQASEHQLVAIERGAAPIFMRIAAMPVLNSFAKTYAAVSGATFIPFGMDHELVVAAGVKSTLQWTDAIQKAGGEMPGSVWSVVSTGVLTRTLQIAWPKKKFTGVAVARNMHPGEIGRAHVTGEDRPFQKPSTYKAEFDSAVTYDLKGYERLMKGRALDRPDERVLFWNVAGNVHPTVLTPADVDSQRGWGERR
jgi:hypothetical protein